MADSHVDLEKQGGRAASLARSSSTSSSNSGSPGRAKELETDSKHRRSGSQSQRSDTLSQGLSDDDDDDDEEEERSPYEALARATAPDLETPAEHAARESMCRVRSTATSVLSSASRMPSFEVIFEPGDPANPKNQSGWYRGWVIFCVSVSTWVVVFYSTSYVSSIPGMMVEFGIESQTVATLGLTTYLVGLAAGSLLVAPLSELYGRRLVYVVCMLLFAALIVPCCLATSLAQIVVLRFFGAVFGAAMISNSVGTIVDIAEADRLSLYMSLWSVAPMNGPVTGPLIGGFVYQYLGWRWDNWIVLIMAGVAWLLMASVRETYPPIILQRKAARIRTETGDDRWWCRYDQNVSALQIFKINMSRPFVLSWSEPILWFFNIWISLAYGILYLCFVAYPIIFVQHRGWGPGVSGLGFVGIGIGTMGTICSEPLLRRWIRSDKKHAKPGGGTTPEAAAKVMTLGAVLTATGQLGFSWTSLPTTIHWAVPIAFGIPFGAGNSMGFIYGGNYLAGAYGNYAASALAGNAVARSAVGGTLPLVGPTMYRALTPQWAGTLLGLLEALMIAVPFVFYRYGDKIRAKSKVIRQMAEDQARNDRNDSRRARHAKAAKRAADATAIAVQEEQATSALQEGEGNERGEQQVSPERRAAAKT